MATEVITNSNQGVVTSGGNTAPASGTVETFDVTAAGFPILAAGQSMRVIDVLDQGRTQGYEIMVVTANANGSAQPWTVTRGAEGTTPYAHGTGWTLIPAPTAAAFDARYLQSFLSYGGTSTDTIRSLSLSSDSFPRFIQRADATFQQASPKAPALWGAHQTPVGGGSDYQWGQESISDTAWMFFQSFPRFHMWDTLGNFMYLQTPTSFPITVPTNLQVSNTSGLAPSGNLTIYNAAALPGSQTGTLSYTSVPDGTHLDGCTTTGIVSNTDRSARFAYWLTDAFSAPILAWANFGGLYINDQLNFRYAGLAATSGQFDIIRGFIDNVNRNSGSQDMWGSDGNVVTKRINDGFGNNEWQIIADSHQFTFGVNGIYPSTAVALGTTGNPWLRLMTNPGTVGAPALTWAAEPSSGWYRNASGDFRYSVAGADAFIVQGAQIIIPTTSTYNIGTDGNVEVDRSNDGFGNNRIQLIADGHQLVWSVAGLFPSTVLNLGIPTAPWNTLNVNQINYTGSITPIGALGAKQFYTAGAPLTCTLTTLNTFVQFASSPTITLPNDSNTYRVELTGIWKSTVIGSSGIGFGTSTSAVLGSIQDVLQTAGLYQPFTVIAYLTGSGQVLDVYGVSAVNAAETLSIIGFTGGEIGPLSFTATRVL